jgi:hypothetical protein
VLLTFFFVYQKKIRSITTTDREDILTNFIYFNKLKKIKSHLAAEQGASTTPNPCYLSASMPPLTYTTFGIPRELRIDSATELLAPDLQCTYTSRSFGKMSALSMIFYSS